MDDLRTTALLYGILSWAFFLKILPYILAIIIGILLCKFLAKQTAKEIRKHNGELARQIAYELNNLAEERQASTKQIPSQSEDKGSEACNVGPGADGGQG